MRQYIQLLRITRDETAASDRTNNKFRTKQQKLANKTNEDRTHSSRKEQHSDINIEHGHVTGGTAVLTMRACSKACCV